ncbi:YciI family protein [Hydrotalea sp.]|uniref:YciI family protein n=1 Tax=Hydrotalea sp. TaxID=2881279 RepID=UPI0026237565|nr:YciI family protein [Hydrotalea sp.]
MKAYLLIFRHENVTGKVSPEQIQIWMQQQTEWINSIQAQNKFIGGTGLLFSDAKVVYHHQTVTDGPFGKGTEMIGGFIHISAQSIEEAVHFAKGAPVLQGEGNTVEVREVVHH